MRLSSGEEVYKAIPMCAELAEVGLQRDGWDFTVDVIWHLTISILNFHNKYLNKMNTFKLIDPLPSSRKAYKM